MMAIIILAKNASFAGKFIEKKRLTEEEKKKGTVPLKRMHSLQREAYKRKREKEFKLRRMPLFIYAYRK